MNKHIIDGLEVLHIPNAFSDDVLRKWEDFYINVPFFNCGGSFCLQAFNNSHVSLTAPLTHCLQAIFASGSF